MMAKYYSFFRYILVFFALFLIESRVCAHRSPYRRNTICVDTQQYIKSKEPIITVWIHGTSFSHRIIRGKPFYGRSEICSHKELRRKTVLHTIGKGLRSFYNNASDCLYFFAWSGNLNARERERAAEKLHASLHVLLKQYHVKHGVYPRLRLITHSHGGNVVLNLARIKSSDALIIDELILLACPVQALTMKYVRHPIFKNIYAFSSNLDLVQVIAPELVRETIHRRLKRGVCIHRLPLSDRYFPLQANLCNIKIKINGRSILHSEFMGPRFLTSLPSCLAGLAQVKKEIAHVRDLTISLYPPHIIITIVPARGSG
jgi:hypothetical protein